MRKSHALRPVLAELSRLPFVERIDLEPLNEAEVVELVTAITGVTPSQVEVGAMVERSEGNPFFAEELLAAGGLGEPGVPTTLRDIWALASTLYPNRRRRCCGSQLPRAVGSTTDSWSAWRAARRRAIRGAADGGRAPALVADGDGYRFRHALLQEPYMNSSCRGNAHDCTVRSRRP